MIELILRRRASMKVQSVISLLFAAAGVAAIGAPAFAGGFAVPSAAFSGREIVLAGGMGGGAGGGMGGGGMGGGMGMGLRYFGGGPMGDFKQQATGSSEGDRAPENYTYQCITPAGRCSFVAPAWLRANSLRSGAGCTCGVGRDTGRVE
jgi:hypothetical protein